MTKTEAAMKWLEEEYGITSESELDRALERTKLNIGMKAEVCKRDRG